MSQINDDLEYLKKNMAYSSDPEIHIFSCTGSDDVPHIRVEQKGRKYAGIRCPECGRTMDDETSRKEFEKLFASWDNGKVSF